MKQMTLRLYEDRIPARHAPIYLPAMARSLYLVEGGIHVEMPQGAQHVVPGSAWVGDSEVSLMAADDDAVIWRWELLPASDESAGALRSAPGAQSTCKLEQVVELDPRMQWLMRCDRVQFPPGGVALTHVHQGPGIRCTLSGEIAIETLGQRHVHGPGQAWFELGHAPVLAPTTEAMSTTFIRCFILPRASRGRSSIRFVYPEDARKVNTQKYHVFGERFIELV